ncbi:YceI family protein [bacterium]|nr:YceI family protein [bacterium]
MKKTRISAPSFRTSLLTFIVSVVCIPGVTLAEAQDLQIDTDKSEVRWLGKKVSGQHNGYVKLKDGTVSVDGRKVLGGTFVVDMSTITNQDIESPKWKAKLENHLKSDDFFNITQFPESRFLITEVKPGSSAQEMLVTGKLTVKDQSHPVTFPAKIVEKDGIYTANGKLTLDRTKWDIRYNSGKWYDPAQLGDKLIYDEIEIELHLATKSS